MRRAALGAVLLACRVAAAQESPAPAPETQPAPATQPDDAAALRKEVADLKDEVERLREDRDYDSSRIDRLMPLTSRISGYLDVGFFAVQGDGAGTRTDIGNRYFPEYAGVVPGSWVFLGDPLSTAVNSRGEPADTGESRAVTFDPIDSRGASSFLVNALNLQIFAGLSDALTLTAIMDFVPRQRDVSDPAGVFTGDFVDVKLAYAEYVAPTEKLDLSLYAGKFDSVLGYEYRAQEASDRLGITPSLICRYTCGHPIGLKARAQLFDHRFIVNVAVTNGDHFIEGFPITDEIDRNHMKTVAGRLAWAIHAGNGVELGVSGAAGAQDRQTDETLFQWHVGADLHADWHDLDLTAEYVKGKVPGKTDTVPCDEAQCLTYQGAYGQLGYRWYNWLTPYARVDWRDALHQSGASFVYISQLMRATAGVHLEVGEHVILKAEYTFNRELGRLPQIPNDVFTTSMVLKY